MWDEACALFEAFRATLSSAGIPLAARLEQDDGVLCTYASGVIRLALPDPSLRGGALRLALIAGSLGIDEARVRWMYDAQISRLVAHEIGHAVRDEAGRMGADPWAEEQAAERLACLLSRPYIDAAARARLRDLVGPAAHALGGLGEAIGTYRLPDRARALPEFAGVVPVRPPAAAYRDFKTFLRVTVAWGYLDLLLDPEDDLDAFRHDMLLAG